MPDDTARLRELPSHGDLAFSLLRALVSEANCGAHIDPGQKNPVIHPGHEAVEGINYNSLNRIVTGYARAQTQALLDRIEALESELERVNTDAIHSCGEHCQRTLCVQRRRIEALEAGLRPFAAVADEYDDREDDSFEVWKDAGPVRTIRSTFRLSLYRAARALLEGEREAPEPGSNEWLKQSPNFHPGDIA